MAFFVGSFFVLFLNRDNLPSRGLFSITSGRSLRRMAIMRTAKAPSMVLLIEWGMITAASVMFRPYGCREDMPISAPAAMAAVKSPKKAETNIMPYKLLPILGLKNLFRVINRMQGIKTPSMPMFKTLAPSTMMPPSAKRRACRVKMIDMEIRPAKGPKIRPMTAPPRRCTVTPPNTGMFRDMAAKKSAVSSPIMGTCCSVSLIFLDAIIQNMRVIMSAGTAIVSVSCPSCRCIFDAPGNMFFKKSITQYKCYYNLN